MWQVVKEHKPYLALIAFDCRIWSLLTNCNPDTDWEALRDGLGKETLKLIVQILLLARCLWKILSS